MIIMVSCNYEKNDRIVVISELKKKLNQSNIEPIPFYQKHNFILTGDDRVFYFKNKHFIEHPCGSIRYDFSNPEFLGLIPSDLYQIELDSLLTKLIMITSENKEIVITIASEFDTIKNKALSTFDDFFISMRKDSLIFGYNYRLMTEEESLVLNAKLNNIKYNPDSVQWKNKFGGIIFTMEIDTTMKY